MWDELKPGCGPDIPVYVRPGDTLDLVIKAKGEGIETVEYTSSHPKGCYEKLLKCKVPEIYANGSVRERFGRRLPMRILGYDEGDNGNGKSAL